MKTSTEQIPSAFPVEHQLNANSEVVQWGEPGMNLRDYFAAKAMAQLIAHKERILGKGEHDGADAEWAVATAAYLQADAMMKARQS